LLETIVALLPSAENVIVIVAELFPGELDRVRACVEPAQTSAAIAAAMKDFCRMMFPLLARGRHRPPRFFECVTKKGEAEVPIRGNRD
jgi:hypothetical protein